MSGITGIQLVAPSTVTVGQPLWLGIRMLTEPYFAPWDCWGVLPRVAGRYNVSCRGIRYMDNVPPEWDGSVTVDGGDGYAGPAAVSFADGSGPYAGDRRPIRRIEGLSFSTPGVKFIRAREPATGIEAVSNPIHVTETTPDDILLWGDIHAQTYFSDGLRCPEELYAFARDEAFLDIFAVSDHAEHLTDRQWEYFTGVANDFNEPGRFATLVGLEWTSFEWGHRNVYYPGDRGPILRATDPVAGRLPELYRIAREHGALVVPHHSASEEMGVDWSLGHDAEVERLVEIHSCWGTSERPAEQGNPRPIRTFKGEKAGQHVVDALRLGRRFGFTGGGDIHDGRPGDELHTLQKDCEQYDLLHRQGIMGVWTKDFSREGVFEALWNRRVYATTNVRMPLRFAIDGHPMGSTVTTDRPLSVRIEVDSAAPVRRVDLVCNGEDLRSLEPNKNTVRWTLREEAAPGEAWYYARVTREDGHMAWSSPIWVNG